MPAHTPQAAHELQRSGHEPFTLEDIDFGRCAAVNLLDWEVCRDQGLSHAGVLKWTGLECCAAASVTESGPTPHILRPPPHLYSSLLPSLLLQAACSGEGACSS